MNNFPSEINIKGKILVEEDKPYQSNFCKYNYSRLEKLFRKDIYDMIISRKDENDYFDLDCFASLYNSDMNDENLKQIVRKIMSELNELGWKTALSFGETGLFIYSTEAKPSSCW